MVYVYQRHNDSGNEQFVGVYDTKKEATIKIKHCYEIDKECRRLGEYEYFSKEH